MPKKRIVRQLRGGQITIPKEFREALNLAPEDMLELTLEGQGLRIRPVMAAQGEGSPWLKELYEAFAPTRAALKDFSDEEINAAIDAAVEEVRVEERVRIGRDRQRRTG